MTEAQEVEVLPLEKKIDFELTKANVTEQVLAELKNKYGNLRLSRLDDHEKYLEIKEAVKDCSKWRNIAVKVCKAGRDEAVKVQKQWVSREKDVVGRICEVEDPLDEEIKKYDAEQERKANEKKRLQEEAYIQRQAMITRMGAIYADGHFNLGEVSFEASLIKDADEETWIDTIVKKFEIEYGKIESVRIEEQRKKLAAEAELQKQRDEFERQQAEFRKQQEEFNRQQEAIKKAERDRIEAEERKKEEERKRLQNERLLLFMPFNPSGLGDMTNLWKMSEEDFKSLLATRKAEFEKEVQEKERILHDKWLADQFEKQRLEAIKKQQQLEEAERQRQAKLSEAKDKEKWEEVMAYLEKTPVFDMRSSQYRTKMKVVRDFLDDLKNK